VQTSAVTRMKTLLVSLAVLAIGAITIVVAQSSCHLREIDLCLAAAISTQKLQTTIPENKKQCTAMREQRECLKNFTNRCGTKTIKGLVKSVSDSGEKSEKVKSFIQAFCTDTDTSEDVKDFLKHAPCLNTAQKSARSGCLKDLTVALDKIITSTNIEIRVPGMCCAFRRTEKCFKDIVREKCGQASMKYLNQLESSVSRIPNIFCREFKPDTPQCKQILPPIGTKPSGQKSQSVISRLLNTAGAL